MMITMMSRPTLFDLPLVALVAFSTTSSSLLYNNVDTRYFIGLLNKGEFSMAVDSCNPVFYSDSLFQIANCDDPDTVTFMYYESADCVSNKTLEETISSSTYQTGQGTFLDFNCDDDKIDATAVIEFSDSPSCQTNNVTFTAALSTCAANTGLNGRYLDEDEYQNINVYCDQRLGFAQIQYFSTPDQDTGTCDSSQLSLLRNITTTCAAFGTFDGIQVYARMISCSESTTEEPTAQPSTLPTQSPSAVPSVTPTNEPTVLPTETPTVVPTQEPSITPTTQPSFDPSVVPTYQPSYVPTVLPTDEPSFMPTVVPSFMPTSVPVIRKKSGSDSDDDGESLTGGDWALIGFGIALVVVAIGALFVCNFVRKRNQNEKGFQLLGDDNAKEPMQRL